MKKGLGISPVLIIMTIVFAAQVQADVLVDGDFEGNGVGNAWITFGSSFAGEVAPGIDSGVEGAETLKLFGNFSSSQNFAGAYQDVAVDGTDFSVGDTILVEGLAGHVSSDPLLGGNIAFLEITFFDSSGGGLGEFGSGANTSAKLSSGSASDQYFSLATSTPTIPVEADFIRVKTIFIQQADNASGAAWFEDVSLTNLSAVPEPGSAGLIALSLIGLMLTRRRQ